MPESQDFYQILRVAPDATASDIRRAYRKLVLTLHPDKQGLLAVTGHNHVAMEAFQHVAEAYEVLGDEFRRLMYDAQRNASLESAQLERSSLLAPKPHQARGGSASMLSPAFYEKSNALWCEQFRERNGKLERRPVSRQGGGGGGGGESRPPTGDVRPLSPRQTPSLPSLGAQDGLQGSIGLGVSSGPDRPPSRQTTSSIGVRQLFLRRSRTPECGGGGGSNQGPSEFPPRRGFLPFAAQDPVDSDLPYFRPIRHASPAAVAARSLPHAAAHALQPPIKASKMTKQERSQWAASVKTLRTFFS